MRQIIPDTLIGEGQHSWPLDLHDLSNGYYYCVLEIGDKHSLIEKILVVE